ncbi:MAG: gatA [Oscillospiraceae bacterium]|nr:gatA [Oscillospiraceae bacterium]
MEKTKGKIKYLGELLRNKEISCQELTTKYLESINQDNGKLNAYVSVTEQEALDTAKAVDKKIASGEELSPLEGIPMTLKDNISTKDIETTCCSKILQGYVPIYNATVWDLLKSQNAVLLGKTNMDEFAMGSSCETSCFGGANNPHNLAHVAGGSSGGVASAVGGNIAAYGLGSDTGGSIRQPASFCGLVGLKPTYGAVSRYGLIAYASSLDQIGPITSTVEDAALVFDAISKKDPMDSTSQGGAEPTLAKLNQDIKGLKIGVAKEYFEGVRDDVKKALEQSIKTYVSLGAQIVYFDLPVLKYALPVYYILACAEASSNLGRYDSIRYGYRTDENYHSIHEMICKTRSEGFGKEVQRRILLGTYVLSSGYYDAYYKKAQRLRGAVVKAFQNAFQSCDVILTPTVPMTAFEQGFSSKDQIETYQTDICTVPINIAGLPAISIPCGFDSKGLPIGMQLIGNTFCESTILNAAYQFENACANQIYKNVDLGVKL